MGRIPICKIFYVAHFINGANRVALPAAYQGSRRQGDNMLNTEARLSQEALAVQHAIN